MDWSADTAADPSAHRIGNGGDKFYSAGGTVDLTNPILPIGAQNQSIFQTQRYDGKSAPSMQWAFDVDPGNIEVRLYFAEWWGSGSAGERVFDVAVEGAVPSAFDDIDIADLAGGKKKGTMLSYTTAVTDGTLNLEFLHGSISNPWLSGIEVINIGEVPPAVTIADVTVDEAAGTATFTATLSKAGTETITVDYTTTDGTATAGSDYTATNGTLSFAVGETTKTFTVAIAEDALYEGDETFTVGLSNVTGGATIGTGTATGTIADNETPPPSLVIADVTVDESAGTATFTVNLSEATNQTITVDYATADDTATAGSDYQTAADTLTFLAGETTKTFTVDILDDTDLEGDETFRVNLSGATGGAIITDATATANIADNDLPNSGVLYRVNVGGDTATAPDSDIDWSADTAANPSIYRVGNGGDKFHANSNTVDLTSPTLPSGALVQDIFQTSRYDGKAAPNMQWAFDVEAGSEVEVRLYFAEWWTDQAGGRIFDVEVEGTVPTVFDDIDLAAIAGGKRQGFMLSHTTTVADGTLDLEFLHGAVSVPWLSGIEIVTADEEVAAEFSAATVAVNETSDTATATADLSTDSLDPGIAANDDTQSADSLITYNFVGDVSQSSSFTMAAEGDSLIGVVATAQEEGVAKDVYRSSKGFGVAGELDGTFNDVIDGNGLGGASDGSIEELILTFDAPVKLETVSFRSSDSNDDYIIEVDGNQFVSGVAATSPALDVSSLNGTGTEFTFTVASDTGSDSYALAGVQVSAI